MFFLLLAELRESGRRGYSSGDGNHDRKDKAVGYGRSGMLVHFHCEYSRDPNAAGNALRNNGRKGALQ